MNISELHAKAASLEQELQATRDLLLQATHDAQASTADLARTRAYAVDCATKPIEETVVACADSLNTG